MNSEVNMTLEEKLKCSYSYDPSTGKIFWKDRFEGREAFSSKSNGYLIGKVLGKIYGAHRVAWFLYYGKWPEGCVDHVNGNPSDNRIVNLRDVDHTSNCKNRRKSSANRSGVVGVYFNKSSGVWCANIKNRGKATHLGSFSCIGKAIKARREAEKVYGFHENHGRR